MKTVKVFMIYEDKNKVNEWLMDVKSMRVKIQSKKDTAELGEYELFEISAIDANGELHERGNILDLEVY